MTCAGAPIGGRAVDAAFSAAVERARPPARRWASGQLPRAGRDGRAGHGCPRGDRREHRRRQGRRQGRGRGDQAAAARRLPRVGLLHLAGARRGADHRRRHRRGDAGRRDLRAQPLGPVRHQRPLSPGQLEAAARPRLDAAPRPHDDLLPDRRHLHAVRAAGARRPARRRDPRRGLDRRDRRRDRRDDLDQPPEVGRRAHLPVARLGRGRRLPADVGGDGRRPASPCSRPAASSTRSARSSTRPSAPTRTRRSSATTRSSTCW